MPYAQGELDGLCGIYAIINAIGATVTGWNRADAERLFQYLIKRLTARRLDHAIADGIGIRDLKTLIRDADIYLAREYGLRIQQRNAFARRVSLDDYWARIRVHLQECGNRVIVGLNGVHRHWTCISTVGERALYVDDSGWRPIQCLYRAHCTTGKPGRRKRHQLVVTQTVLISVFNGGNYEFIDKHTAQWERYYRYDD